LYGTVVKIVRGGALIDCSVGNAGGGETNKKNELDQERVYGLILFQDAVDISIETRKGTSTESYNSDFDDDTNDDDNDDDDGMKPSAWKTWIGLRMRTMLMTMTMMRIWKISMTKYERKI
jgi:hypothetical protein